MYREISAFRRQSAPLSPADIAKVFTSILDPEVVDQFNEKFLSLTLSLILNPVHYPIDHPDTAAAVDTLLKRSLQREDLTLQGCNQILGAFAKLKTKHPNVDMDSYRSTLESVLNVFRSKYVTDCPNRELSNVVYASLVLGLPGGGEPLLAATTRPIPDILSSMDCTDLALICAGLMDFPDNPVWKPVRLELLKRRTFTAKDIPSIMCSLACSGVNDRELILHLSTIIVRENLVNRRNVAGIVWAVATCDGIHPPLLAMAESVIAKDGDRINDSMDIRRISRGFAMSGQLARIESWLLNKLAQSTGGNAMSDSVVVWELVTNRLIPSALSVFRTKPISAWKNEVTQSQWAASQLYHLYLGSLIDDTVTLTPKEREFLVSLRSKFSPTTEDMLSSVLHRQASGALKDLSYEHVSEYEEPTTGFVIDSYIPSLNTGVEVQGPTHFITDLETGSSILRPADRFKHEVLRKVSSMKIVQATPWNFGPKINRPNKVLMKALIEGVPLSMLRETRVRAPKAKMSERGDGSKVAAKAARAKKAEAIKFKEETAPKQSWESRGDSQPPKVSWKDRTELEQ